MAVLRDLVALVREYWGTIGLAVTWLGIALIYFRKRMHWRRKHFLDQVNFSLNYVHDGKLVMRTLMELPSQQVWLNDYGVKQVQAAAQKTTLEQPFIILKEPADQQFINRAVLNGLSERFAEMYLARALGLPVQSGTFYFAITCEKYKEMRTYKLRVLILSEQALREDFAPGGKGDSMVIRDVIYRPRQMTLRAIYQLYLRDQQTPNPVLGQMELGLPVPPHLS